MDKFECMACGYIYDPEIGHEESGIAPGTPFSQLPETWVCPECGSPKEQFEKLDKVENREEFETPGLSE